MKLNMNNGGSAGKRKDKKGDKKGYSAGAMALCGMSDNDDDDDEASPEAATTTIEAEFMSMEKELSPSAHLQRQNDAAIEVGFFSSGFVWECTFKSLRS